MSTMNHILGRPDDDDEKKKPTGQAQRATAEEAPFVGNSMTADEMSAVGAQVEKSNVRQPGQRTHQETARGTVPSQNRFGDVTATSQVGANPGDVSGLVPAASQVPSTPEVPTAKDIRESADAATELKNYRQMLDYYGRNIETPEQQAKREKREKRERFFSQMSDALGAMHRAYAHARGIEPMKLTQNAEDKTLKRQQLLQSQRDRNAAAYSQAYERMMSGRRAQLKEAEDREYRARMLEIQKQNADSLRDYRKGQGDNASKRTTSYVEDKQNQIENRDEATDSLVKYREALGAAASRRAAAAETRAAKSGRTGGSTSRGGKGSGSLSNNPDYAKVTDRSDPLRTRVYFEGRGGSTTSGGQKGSTAAGVAGGSQAGVTAPKSKRRSRTRL